MYVIPKHDVKNTGFDRMMTRQQHMTWREYDVTLRDIYRSQECYIASLDCCTTACSVVTICDVYLLSSLLCSLMRTSSAISLAVLRPSKSSTPTARPKTRLRHTTTRPVCSFSGAWKQRTQDKTTQHTHQTKHISEKCVLMSKRSPITTIMMTMMK